jgi:hypothetical protein
MVATAPVGSGLRAGPRCAGRDSRAGAILIGPSRGPRGASIGHNVPAFLSGVGPPSQVSTHRAPIRPSPSGGCSEASLIYVELSGTDRFIAVTMTREQTLLLTEDELSELVGKVSASSDQLLSLVEDTDVHHPALEAWFGAHEGQTYVSYTARPT